VDVSSCTWQHTEIGKTSQRLSFISEEERFRDGILYSFFVGT